MSVEETKNGVFVKFPDGYRCEESTIENVGENQLGYILMETCFTVILLMQAYPIP